MATMHKWEEKGLLEIFKETGEWNEEQLKYVGEHFLDSESLEYKILYGGISFADIDYEKFDEAMEKIEEKCRESTVTDRRSMHEMWVSAAMDEVVNSYD